ncbi:MAG: 1-phosphofructokinase family hexose kinase [Spirochaetales bacterium]|nr:1-phosphofructokinase family hexose kinase [Spirochaetales bacterium]
MAAGSLGQGSAILTLTMNPAVDFSAAVDQVIEGDKLRCRDPRQEPGGGGINVSRAVARLGGASRALYTAGGPYGRLLQELLDGEGLDHRAFAVRGLTRQNIMIMETGTSRQYRFNLPGPPLSGEEWQGILEGVYAMVGEGDFLVASGSLPPGVPEDFYARLAAIAAKRRSRLVVDTSGKRLRRAVTEGVYLVKPNLRELRDISGREIEHEDEQKAAARAIVEGGKTEVVVLSLGASGALLVTRDTELRYRSPSVRIRSRVGAGDSMLAGIVLRLAAGEPIEEAVRFGVAAGAAAVMTPGTELCRREDAERLYRDMKEDAEG